MATAEDAQHSEAPLTLAASQPAPHPTLPASRVTLVTGVACALCTGIFDGSLMAPFSSFRRGAAASSLTSEEVALEYLGSFAIALPAVALPMLLLSFGLRALASPPSAPGVSLRELLQGAKAVAAPGLCCGGLWAAGNVLSVHATLRLGQAVGFPLTQVCVVVSALWGVLYFGELRDRKALQLFCAASLVVLAGATALKAAGGGGS
jgi:hypothetical protein